MVVSKTCFQLFIYRLTIKAPPAPPFPPVTLLSRQGLPLRYTEFLFKSLSKFHSGQGIRVWFPPQLSNL